jgi:hypothetical protein
MSLTEEILKLKKEKNAVILATTTSGEASLTTQATRSAEPEGRV